MEEPQRELDTIGKGRFTVMNDSRATYADGKREIKGYIEITRYRGETKRAKKKNVRRCMMT